MTTSLPRHLFRRGSDPRWWQVFEKKKPSRVKERLNFSKLICGCCGLTPTRTRFRVFRGRLSKELQSKLRLEQSRIIFIIFPTFFFLGGGDYLEEDKQVKDLYPGYEFPFRTKVYFGKIFKGILTSLEKIGPNYPFFWKGFRGGS